MTVLITGGAGYIGGHAFLAFLDRGEIPVVLDDLSTGSRSAIPSEVPFIFGDVGDTSLLLQIIEAHKIDAILHFAAKVVVPDSIADPLRLLFEQHCKDAAFTRGSGERKS
jgi:UDP-glucose 4-epimerase